MLATPVSDAPEVVRRVGEEAWIEDKYDGIRRQLHLAPETDGPRLFSRDLNDVTVSFPEVVAAVRSVDHRLVLDGELVPYREGAVLDFAALQTRLGRVRPDPQAGGADPGGARRLRPPAHRRHGPARPPAARAPCRPRGAAPAGAPRRRDPLLAPGHRPRSGRGRRRVRRGARAPQRGADGQGPGVDLPARSPRAGLAQAQARPRDPGLRRGRRRVGPRQAARRPLRLHVRGARSGWRKRCSPSARPTPG